MTKKHFIAIALILGRSDLTEEQILSLAEDFADFFAQENRNFRHSTFIEAVTHEMGRVRYEEKKELSKTLDKMRSEVSHIPAWMRLASQSLEEE